MAAVDSLEAERPRDNPLINSDKGDVKENGESECSSGAPGNVVHDDEVSRDNNADANETREHNVDPAGVLDSPNETSVVLPNNDDSVASSALVDSTFSEAEAKRTVTSPDYQREFEWSETEEDFELITHSKESNENAVHEAGVEITPEVKDKTVEDLTSDTEYAEKEKSPRIRDEESVSKDVSEMEGEGDAEGGEEGGAEGGGEEGGEGVGGEEGPVVKPRKSRLECRECGKRFTRRETFNLHRHFHMHQDEQASLTCKECGLTFQHRSSLIKHRSEHKEKSAPPPSSERRALYRENSREERSPQCEHCGDTFPTLVKLRGHGCERAPEKLYRCPLCRKEFQYKVSINAHMQTHSLDSPFRCLECNKGFQCALTLRIHQRSHAALKPYECPECGMVFRHRSVMEDHRRKHTEERPYQCNICGKSFKYGSLLHQHQYLHTGQKPFRCPDCGKKFAFAQNMRAHCRQHKKHPHDCPHCPLTFPDQASLQAHIPNHDVPLGGATGAMDKENTNHDVEQRRVFNCPLCPQIFHKPVDLRAHMLIHEAEYDKMSNGKEQEQVHVCPRCPLRFSNESSLQTHMSTHEATPFKREVRGLGVGRADSIENMPGVGGWGDQTDKKPLKCRECGKGFRHRSVLELHMRIHNKDKPYQCNVCAKSFRFSSYLQQHIIIHTGKKPYKCPDCGKDFAFLQNMKTHQRLHQQKPFRCTQCRKGYSEESQLQRHMLSHTGDKPHKCHLCDKSFGLAYLLRDHLNTHTGERPHRCQECHKCFPWLSSLLVHQKIHMRKYQGVGQVYSFPTASQRGRTRGIGSRGRRGSRWASGWPRWATGVERAVPPQASPHPVPISRGPEWQRGMTPQPQPAIFAPHSDFQEQSQQRPQQPQWQPVQQQQWKPEGDHRPVQQQQSWPPEKQPRPVQLQQQWQPETQPQQTQLQQQWQVEIRPQSKQQQQLQQSQKWPPEIQPKPVQHQPQQWQPEAQSRPILQQQWPPEGQPKPAHQQQQQRRSPGWADAALSTATVPAPIQFPEHHPPREDGTTAWASKTPPVVPLIPSPSKAAGNEQEQQQQRQQQPPFWVNSPASAPNSVHYESSKSTRGVDGVALWGVKTPSPVPKTQSPNKLKDGQEPQLSQWPNIPASSQTTKHDLSTPSPKDDSKTWGFKTPLGIPQTGSPSDKHGNGRDLQRQSPGTANPSVSTAVTSESARPSPVPESNLWGFKTSPGIPKILSLPDKHGNEGEQQQPQLQLQQQLPQLQQQPPPLQQQQLQQQLQHQHNQMSSAWVNASTSTQMGPITIQYGTARFPPGDGATVWGFQTTPVVSQTLIAGPIQQGNGRAQQPLPMVTGPQILINQASPFLSPTLPPLPPLTLPAPHPLHSVAVGQLPRPPPQNLYFTPQGIISERPHMPQTLPLPQLAQRTEPHKLGSRLPFASDRLLQCMICGCSLPRELDLQIHYMQHAQGEI